MLSSNNWTNNRQSYELVIMKSDVGVELLRTHKAPVKY